MTQHAAAQAATLLREEQTALPREVGIREQLGATTQAVLAADEAHLREALASMRWERRGPLQRLVCRPHP